MPGDEELPWTTSRCNRLLRPLSSKLAKLRKEIERLRSITSETRTISTAFATKKSPAKTTNFTRPAHRPRGFEKKRDPDWRPGPNAPGKKKTYGGRGAKKTAGVSRAHAQSEPSSRLGEIAFTPLLSRMSSQLQSSPIYSESPLRKQNRNRGVFQANVEWAQSSGTQHVVDIQKLVQGVTESFANLIQATSSAKDRGQLGSKSLFTTCLRGMPAYIELEEHFAKLDREEEDIDEDRDVANEVYEHLESQFEQRHSQGWPGARLVVRAHATSIICAAVADRTLEPGIIAILVDRCGEMRAFDEAERILRANIPNIEPFQIPNSLRADLFDANTSLYMRAVKTFTDRSRRFQLLFDLFDHMVALELLPLEWLATDSMQEIWECLISKIANEKKCVPAFIVKFIETVTIASIGLPDERLLEDEETGAGSRQFVPSSRNELRKALDRTFFMLWAFLGSKILTSRDINEHNAIGERATWALDFIAVSISQRKDIRTEMSFLDPTSEDQRVFAQRALWAIATPFFVRLGTSSHDSAMSTLTMMNLNRLLNATMLQYDRKEMDYCTIFGSLPVLINAIARGTGHLRKDDGFGQIQQLALSLMSISGSRLPHKLWTMKRIALEAATAFASYTNQPEHAVFAQSIEKMMRIQGRLIIAHSPQKNDSPSGAGEFRWEEGIGEWVTCTPFIKQVPKETPKQSIPPLQLLPTPTTSEDEHDGEGNPDVDGTTLWETTECDQEDEDQVPQSSPIKVAQRPTSSLGKRVRLSQPIVLVPIKKARMTPPDSPITFYPDVSDEKRDTEEGTSDEEVNKGTKVRRSRRSRKEIQALSARLRTQRSRTSRTSGLRNIKSKIYTVDIHPDDEEIVSEDDSDSQAPLQHNAVRLQPARRGRPRKQAGLLQGQGRKRAAAPATLDDDELTITSALPGTKRRVSGRETTKGRREWWKVNGGVVADSEGSEDELGFN